MKSTSCISPFRFCKALPNEPTQQLVWLGLVTSRAIAFALVAVLFGAAAPYTPGQSTDVLTYHTDPARTGQNLHEEILTLSNVNTNHFGKLRTLATDGKVDAQPLYAAGVAIPGKGVHNLLFVETEHDSVYAFDADNGQILWQVSMLGTNETTSDARGCSQVTPEIGITATPVIDRQLGVNGTMFLVAMSKNGSSYFQRLHALDLATGADVAPPTTVTAIYVGAGDNSGGGFVVFNPAQYEERSGLLLMNGVIYTAWTSHCDIRPYTGWVMGFDEVTLAQTSVINVTPNGNEGAIWMAGAGLASDTDSNIYFLDGNGTLDTTLTPSGFPINGDYGNSFMKLSTSNNVLSVADYFATYNSVAENNADQDLGSGGALVLPDMTDAQGNTRKLAVGAGKDSNIYLVDRTDMGKFNPANNSAIYQEMSGAIFGGVWAMPAYFNGTLYYGASGDRIRAFPFQDARLMPQSSQSSASFAYPGATPGVSGNASSNGIVWVAENVSPAVLHAYAATNLGVEIYNSNMAGGGRDHFGTGNKFITPTIASARVYVGTTSGVGVFGLLDQSSLTPLQIWRDDNFGNPSNVGAGANGSNPSGDGVPNLIKYALGLDPATIAGSGQLPSGGIETDGGTNYLTLSVNRAATASDITYIVEVSGDLLNWESGPPDTVVLTNTATELVVRDNVPVPSANARFIRLRVTNP